MTEVEERVFTAAYNNTCDIPEYVRLLNEAVYFGEKIMNILGRDSILFLKYQRATCLAKSIRLKEAYKLGVQDGREYAQQNAQQSIQIHNINI